MPEAAPAASPLAALLPLVPDPELPPCRTCGGERAYVPPARIWFGCPTCHPATFERS